jgi:predicted DNA-binding mobile mystery protein A
MVKDNVQARRRLDERFRRLKPLADEPRPHKGWIRAIRDALGMTSTELAARLNVSQQNVSQMEHNEVQDTITLDTLRRAASALDCDLVYVLEPRTSLDEVVREQAHKKAARHLAPLAHHSRLEDQALSDDDEAAQLEEFASRFVDRKGLWSETDDPQ